jgi:trimeric autotransporter adhesin
MTRRLISLQPNTLHPCIIILLALFARSSPLQALTPAPDGGYPGNNTAEGLNALFSLTTGINNTAVGANALLRTTDGSYNAAFGSRALENNIHGAFNMAVGTQALFNNTANANMAVGFRVLFNNTTGSDLTGIGTGALFSNTTGKENTAIGSGALLSNTTADGNTAIGRQALFNNTIGGSNTANGFQALFHNTTGVLNTATGVRALLNNTTGPFNHAIGGDALAANTTGFGNIAMGDEALFSSTGSSNTAIGDSAGLNATTGSDNVYIGAGMFGIAGESHACYISSIFGQTSASGIPVLINSNNKLGTTTSSKRFKEDIKPIDKGSEALFALQPVSFRYKKELDPAATPQFGLVAEDVEKVNAALVVRDQEGKPYTVRYDQVNAMLLNEFLKEHRKVEQLQKEMRTIVARLKEQETKIQKVSARVEVSKATPKTVANDN